MFMKCSGNKANLYQSFFVEQEVFKLQVEASVILELLPGTLLFYILKFHAMFIYTTYTKFHVF